MVGCGMTGNTVLGAEPRLQLFAGFTLSVADHPVGLGAASARIFAALALQRRPMTRPALAEAVWPDRPANRATANLRTTIWRLPTVVRPLLVGDSQHFTLADHVTVDVHRMVNRCRVLLGSSARPGGAVLAVPSGQAWQDELLDDLLPAWDDDWVVVERARLRQLRLHALDALAVTLLEQGRIGEAVDAATAAIDAEPLRESAVQALIRAHLRGGNVAQAHRAFREYRQLLDDDLGIEPSAAMSSMLQGDRSATTG
jgi:DNA-binding SARP family transcriptional activator